MISQQQQYAGFWRRLAAVILDSMLFFTLTAPLLYLVYGHDYFHWLIINNDFLDLYGAWDLILVRLLPVCLTVYLWQCMGATPGKLLMSCRVVDSTTLQNPGWAKAAIRFLCYIPSSLPLYLGFAWIGWDKRKQGFHDKMAKTLVLYSPHDYADQPLEKLMDEALN